MADVRQQLIDYYRGERAAVLDAAERPDFERWVVARLCACDDPGRRYLTVDAVMDVLTDGT